MIVTAIEKDPRISQKAAAILRKAQELGFAERVHFKPATDALDVSWAEEDVVLFFYTHSRTQEKLRDALREQLQNKMRRVKKDSLFAMVFTWGHTAQEHHVFSRLQGAFGEPKWVPYTGYRIQFYRYKEVPGQHERISKEDKSSSPLAKSRRRPAAGSPVGYRRTSNVFEENLRKMSKHLRTFNPSRPLTLLLGGISRQITSIFFRVASHIWKVGTVTIDTYSVPLAVRISIFRRDFVGSQPMLRRHRLGYW